MAGSPFDRLRKTAFSIVKNVMGYSASWTPSTGGVAQTAKVLFKDPTVMHRLNGPEGPFIKIEYGPFDYIMEYDLGIFPALQDNVREKLTEIVTIDGRNYGVRDVKSKWDGNTFIATMQLIEA